MKKYPNEIWYFPFILVPGCWLKARRNFHAFIKFNQQTQYKVATTLKKSWQCFFYMYLICYNRLSNYCNCNSNHFTHSINFCFFKNLFIVTCNTASNSSYITSTSTVTTNTFIITIFPALIKQKLQDRAHQITISNRSPLSIQSWKVYPKKCATNLFKSCGSVTVIKLYLKRFIFFLKRAT